jgi:hypothetical protein
VERAAPPLRNGTVPLQREVTPPPHTHTRTRTL